MTFRLVGGDCIEAMQAMAENSVDAVVTDPPYGIRFMGKAWDAFGVAEAVRREEELGPRPYQQAQPRMGTAVKASASMQAGKYDLSPTANRAFQEWTRLWAREALRVLKPGGHLLSSCSTRTYHRMTAGIEDAGFEIRDCLAWMYGSGFPKSLNIGNGYGTALKPAFEPIVLARKPLSERNVAANVHRWGTGALNIDGCRIATDDETARAKYPNRSEIIPMQRGVPTGGNGSPYGRWPANVTLDPEAARLLDEQTGELPAGVAVRHRGVTSNGVTGWGKHDPGTPDMGYGDTGGASRFFYCPKADREERNRGLGHMAQGSVEGLNHSPRDDGQVRARIAASNTHPTVKPVELMRWLCRMVAPKGGTVLDPFTGSGSTGVAAMREGFEFIGIEREAEYVEIARARIIGDAPLFNLEAVGGGPTG